MKSSTDWHYLLVFRSRAYNFLQYSECSPPSNVTAVTLAKVARPTHAMSCQLFSLFGSKHALGVMSTVQMKTPSLFKEGL
jgi:hypothetical protein